MCEEPEQSARDGHGRCRQRQAARPEPEICERSQTAAAAEREDHHGEEQKFTAVDLAVPDPMTPHHADIGNGPGDVGGADHQPAIAAGHGVLEPAGHRDRGQAEEVSYHQQAGRDGEQGAFHQYHDAVAPARHPLKRPHHQAGDHRAEQEAEDDAGGRQTVRHPAIGEIEPEMGHGARHVADRRAEKAEGHRIDVACGARQSGRAGKEVPHAAMHLVRVEGSGMGARLRVPDPDFYTSIRRSTLHRAVRKCHLAAESWLAFLTTVA